MQPYYPPDFIRTDHELMVRKELQRNHPEHHLYFRDSDQVAAVLMAFRRIVGRWLIDAGTRIEPGTRRTGKASVPADVAMTKRLGRA